MREEFLKFINDLILHDEDYANTIMTDDVKDYLDLLKNGNEGRKSEITDNGKLILKYMQDNNIKMAKSRDIADGIGLSSRTVGGSLRKLVTDGFFDKIGNNPVVYTITEKGKNYKID
jgi:predicted transcriptional regulator